MRKVIVLLSLGFLFLFAACSSDNGENENDTENEVAEEEQSNPEETVVEEDEVEEEEVEVTETLDDLKMQPPGTLVSNLTLEEELSMETKQLIEKIGVDLQEALANMMQEAKSAREIEAQLMKLLGSPNYEEAITLAEEFEVSFKEPYLPRPERVSKGGKGQGIGKAIILLDASSSMLLSVDGKVKMDIAKDAVKRFADVIGQDSDVSLVVYGHQGSESNADKQLSCESIEEIYPMGAYDSERFDEALTQFESKGWTPLAGAIEKATEMSNNLEGAITVYIVSDGVETCDGDPVQAAENFVKENEDRSVNIIGFNVDKQAEEQLMAVSEAGNGSYFSANNAEEIQETIEYEWLPSLTELAWAHTKAPGPWEIIHEENRYKDEHARIRKILDKELERLRAAMDILYQEDLIDSDVGSKVRDYMMARYYHRMELQKALQSEKIKEINAVADDIKKRVNDWIEEMREIVHE